MGGNADGADCGQQVNKANAEHYTWGQSCEGWYLVKNDRMTIIQERMPPGSSETLHRHAHSRQFFFILGGSAVMEHGARSLFLRREAALKSLPVFRTESSIRVTSISKSLLLRSRRVTATGWNESHT
jgi:hypothetical protein